ncbi:MAG: methylmalonyl-CoA epimerase [Dehalococcoidia bacterium]|nr:methylmalonyl-CoA epimerase [Dehalococcoidia bacterium]
MIKRVDHIAIAVNSADDALSVFDSVFGLKADHIEELPDQGVKAAIVRVGDTNIEFIEPTDPEGGVAKFIEKKGEGFHHICVEVDDIDEELRSLAARGVELIDKQARKGLAGRIGFLHPRATKGVLIELVQKV